MLATSHISAHHAGLIARECEEKVHSRIATVAFCGIETIDVEVLVHITNGLPSMAIVGLADKSVDCRCFEGSCTF